MEAGVWWRLPGTFVNLWSVLSPSKSSMSCFVYTWQDDQVAEDDLKLATPMTIFEHIWKKIPFAFGAWSQFHNASALCKHHQAAPHLAATNSEIAMENRKLSMTTSHKLHKCDYPHTKVRFRDASCVSSVWPFKPWDGWSLQFKGCVWIEKR